MFYHTSDLLSVKIAVTKSFVPTYTDIAENPAAKENHFSETDRCDRVHEDQDQIVGRLLRRQIRPIRQIQAQTEQEKGRERGNLWIFVNMRATKKMKLERAPPCGKTP